MIMTQFGNPYESEEDSRLEQLWKIAKSKQLTKDMKAEAEKYKKLEELAFADEVETIKSIVRTTEYTFVCESAQKWLSMKKEGKIDGRKKYDEKASFDFLTEKLKDLFGVDVEITRIVYEGYEGYQWNITFVYNDITYELHIPVIEKMNTRNYQYMQEGKFYLGYRKNESCIDFIASSYLEDDLKKGLEKVNEIGAQLEKHIEENEKRKKKQNNFCHKSPHTLYNIRGDYND